MSTSSTATKAPFPSLLIRATELIPQGAFAEAQAAFLAPEQELIVQLNGALSAGNVGVVAHFYMDVELQGGADRGLHERLLARVVNQHLIRKNPTPTPETH